METDGVVRSVRIFCGLLFFHLLILIVVLLVGNSCAYGYGPTLSKLLHLAPRPEHTGALMMENNVAQSILVTHYVDYNSNNHYHDPSADDPDGEEDDVVAVEPSENFSDLYTDSSTTSAAAMVEDEGSCGSNNGGQQPQLLRGTTTTGAGPSMPWPNNNDNPHEPSFWETNRQRLCLEIASGYAAQHAPTWMRDRQVLLPGSLRERGEFSIVRVSLVPVATNDDVASSSKQQPQPQHPQHRFHWEVQTIDFHVLNSFAK